MKTLKTSHFNFHFSIFLLCGKHVSKSEQSVSTAQKSEFWSKVRFGGNLGLALETILPILLSLRELFMTLINTLSLGFGIQGSYIKQKKFLNLYIYGPSMIVLGNPIPEIQLSRLS
jgi:hypothetical protein